MPRVWTYARAQGTVGHRLYSLPRKARTRWAKGGRMDETTSRSIGVPGMTCTVGAGQYGVTCSIIRPQVPRIMNATREGTRECCGRARGKRVSTSKTGSGGEAGRCSVTVGQGTQADTRGGERFPFSWARFSMLLLSACCPICNKAARPALTWQRFFRTSQVAYTGQGHSK